MSGCVENTPHTHTHSRGLSVAFVPSGRVVGSVVWTGWPVQGMRDWVRLALTAKRSAAVR